MVWYDDECDKIIASWVITYDKERKATENCRRYFYEIDNVTNFVRNITRGEGMMIKVTISHKIQIKSQDRKRWQYFIQRFFIKKKNIWKCGTWSVDFLNDNEGRDESGNSLIDGKVVMSSKAVVILTRDANVSSHPPH